MKVPGQNTPNSPIELAYVKKAQQQRASMNSQTKSAEKTGTGDTVELSDQAKQLQKATKSVSTISNASNEKMQKIKMEVEKGTYTVDSTRAANKMLNEAFENDIILRKISPKS